jgi:hypothetical protein
MSILGTNNCREDVNILVDESSISKQEDFILNDFLSF